MGPTPLSRLLGLSKGQVVRLTFINNQARADCKGWFGARPHVLNLQITRSQASSKLLGKA